MFLCNIFNTQKEIILTFLKSLLFVKSSFVSDTKQYLIICKFSNLLPHRIVCWIKSDNAFKRPNAVQLFVTPWTLCDSREACQTSLSFTISWNLLKFMSIELVMSFNHLILSSPSPAFNLFQHQGLYK